MENGALPPLILFARQMSLFYDGIDFLFFHYQAI